MNYAMGLRRGIGPHIIGEDATELIHIGQSVILRNGSLNTTTGKVDRI